MADGSNNRLLIYANQENYGVIKHALEQLDRPPMQVAIEATIAEVTLNDNLQYGVQFFVKSSNLGAPPNTGSIVNTAANVAANALINRVLPGFNFLIGTEAQPQVIINALHAVTEVKIFLIRRWLWSTIKLRLYKSATKFRSPRNPRNR